MIVPVPVSPWTPRLQTNPNRVLRVSPRFFRHPDIEGYARL